MDFGVLGCFFLVFLLVLDRGFVTFYYFLLLPWGQVIHVKYGMVWNGMVWCGMVWYGVVWCGVVWYGMYGMVCIKAEHRNLDGSSRMASKQTMLIYFY